MSDLLNFLNKYCSIVPENIFNFILPSDSSYFREKSKTIYTQNLPSVGSAYFLTQIQQQRHQPIIVVCSLEQQAQQFHQDLHTLGQKQVFYCPHFSSTIFSLHNTSLMHFLSRVQAIDALYQGINGIYIFSLESFLYPLLDPSLWLKQQFSIQVQRSISLDQLEQYLLDNEFIKVPKVTLKGEYSRKGDIIDIFSFHQEHPFRILLEYDQVYSIHQFYLDNQKNYKSFDKIILLPKKEINTSHFQQGIQQKLSPEHQEILEASPLFPQELLFPYLAKESILSFLRKSQEIQNKPVICPTIFYADWDQCERQLSNIKRTYQQFYQTYTQEYPFLLTEQQFYLDFQKYCDSADQLIKNLHFPIASNGVEPLEALDTLEPEYKEQKTWIRKDDQKKPIQSHKKQDLSSVFSLEDIRQDQLIDFALQQAPSFLDHIDLAKKNLEKLIAQGYHIGFCLPSNMQKNSYQYLFKGIPMEFIIANISEGFIDQKNKVLLVQTQNFFANKKKLIQFSPDKVQSIQTHLDLEKQDYVVHIFHGVGIFKDIQRMKIGTIEKDYLKIEFAKQEILFVPIEQINLVQKYIGSAHKPALDQLSGSQWNAKKVKAKKAAEQLAQYLVDIYAQRQKAKGFAFGKDNEFQYEFEMAFPYAETEDQLTCIEQIKLDMEQEKVMDRLLCGDVGYGKTEIAMRACFKAVMSGKQVAYLVPTTVLCDQHYETFSQRFKRFPVKVAQLSGLNTIGQNKKILEAMSEGKIDIVIGTQSLVQAKVQFKNLGLLVIDEEQRFGVKDKEKLKKLRANVDCLSITATPIPRTLYMSLVSIKDFSILATAPKNRKAVQTQVCVWDEKIIKLAIKQELERKGQVYYIHNHIESLEQVEIFLKNLINEPVRIGTIHGKMSSDQIESVMHEFHRGMIHILLSTSIIENGIDIANVNTIIIDRADRYGLAQLYQLRGRVGRSGVKAYAYLFYQKDNLTELAQKRLKVIAENTQLGSGMNVSMKDLEIRGSGDLLGKDQHGFLVSVGLQLYLSMVSQAVEKLQDKGNNWEVYLELIYTGYIPDEYIEDVMEKMEIYKRISSTTNKAEKQDLIEQLTERFGDIPAPLEDLLLVIDLRLFSQEKQIEAIIEKKEHIILRLRQVNDIPLETIVEFFKHNYIKKGEKENEILVIKKQLIACEGRSKLKGINEFLIELYEQKT